MTTLFTSVQFLNCTTRMCVTMKQRIMKVLKKKKKPHPDPDEIIMKLSPRIVLNKTQTIYAFLVPFNIRGPP